MHTDRVSISVGDTFDCCLTNKNFFVVLSVFWQGLDLSFLDPKAPDDVAAVPKDAEILPSAFALAAYSTASEESSSPFLATQTPSLQGGLATKMLLRPTCALSKSIPLTRPGFTGTVHGLREVQVPIYESLKDHSNLRAQLCQCCSQEYFFN